MNFSCLHPRDQIVATMERIYDDAFDRLEVLEATAAAIIKSRPLGPISPMSDEVTRDLLAAFPGL